MIIEGKNDLLRAEADALVNTVNTVGVMGRGLALQFKQAFPENFKAYQSACRRGEVKLGEIFVTRTGQLQPSYILNFPTKGHWRSQTNIEDIKAGLQDLVRVVQENKISSLAIPPLGCGLGGLRWEEVRPLIVEAFAPLEEVEVQLYAPGLTVEATETIVRTNKPILNLWRASLIRLVEAYSVLAYEASHLEAQKLLYFLWIAGEPLKVQFNKEDYGPYDAGMKHGLLDLEGHYIRGFGEGERLSPVALMPGASEEAQEFLKDKPETNTRIERVCELIHEFETPYGLELLASVHWVTTQEVPFVMDDPEMAVKRVHAWSERKRKALQSEDIEVAWQCLSEKGWLQSSSVDGESVEPIMT